jgi:Protein of unknown function (DUF2442)
MVAWDPGVIVRPAAEDPEVAHETRDWRGVLEPLRDPAYFVRVVVDPERGTIAWPNGVDLTPEPLYAEARANLARVSTSR